MTKASGVLWSMRLRHDGPVPQETTAPSWHVTRPGRLLRVRASLLVPGRSWTFVTVNRNGVSVAALALSAGTTRTALQAVGVAFRPGDRLTVTAVGGAGAEYLRIVVLFDRDDGGE